MFLVPIAVLMFLLWKVPEWELRHLSPDTLGAVKQHELINESRKTLAQIVAGFLLLAGFYFTWRQLSLSLQGQITDRFTKAIDQLASDKLAARLGGIYALERISKDSPEDFWTVVEVLTAFIREQAPLTRSSRLENTELSLQEKLRADIQAALTVLGRRSHFDRHGQNGPYMELSGTDLARAFLPSAHLERSNLEGVDLRNAVLAYARLNGAILRKANLEGADLFAAHLYGTDLREANLRGAHLNLTQLKNAVLAGAHLEEAILHGTNLSGTDLANANLDGTFQLALAVLDSSTRLPANMAKDLDSKYASGFPCGFNFDTAHGFMLIKSAYATFTNRTAYSFKLVDIKCSDPFCFQLVSNTDETKTLFILRFVRISKIIPLLAVAYKDEKDLIAAIPKADAANQFRLIADDIDVSLENSWKTAGAARVAEITEWGIDQIMAAKRLTISVEGAMFPLSEEKGLEYFKKALASVRVSTP
jgi:uncharacterized protein YjbI with pentapeptide repeats